VFLVYEIVQQSFCMKWFRSHFLKFRKWCRSPCSGDGAGVLVYEMMQEFLFRRWCRSPRAGGGAGVLVYEMVQESLFSRWSRSPCSGDGAGVLVQKVVQESLFRKWCRSPCLWDGAGVLVQEMVQESLSMRWCRSLFSSRLRTAVSSCGTREAAGGQYCYPGGQSSAPADRRLLEQKSTGAS
jgi:hypothetical protein